MSNWVDEAVYNRPVPVNRQSGGWWWVGDVDPPCQAENIEAQRMTDRNRKYSRSYLFLTLLAVSGSQFTTACISITHCACGLLFTIRTGCSSSTSCPVLINL